MVSRLVPILMVGLMLSACASAPAKESTGAGWRLPTTEEMMASCMPKAKKLMALLDAGVWFEANAKAIDTLYSSHDERKQAYEYGFQIARGEINAEMHEKLAKEYCQARVLEFIENFAAAPLPAFEEWEKSLRLRLERDRPIYCTATHLGWWAQIVCD